MKNNNSIHQTDNTSYHNQTFWLLLWGACLGSALMLYNISITVSFLTIFNFDKLALAFMITGIVGFVAGNIFTYLQLYTPFRQLSIFFFALLVIAISTVTIYYYTPLSVSKRHWVIFLGFSLSLSLQNLSLMIFWGLFGRLFDVQKTKNLANKIGKGITIAGIATCVMILVVSGSVGYAALQYFLAVGCLLFIVSFFVLIYINICIPSTHIEDSNAQLIRANNNFGQIVRNNYVIYLILFAIISVMVSFYVDFLFLFASEHKYPDIKDLTEFLAILLGASAVMSFLIKTFLYEYIILKYGTRTGLLMLPVVLIVFMALALAISLIFGVKADGLLLFFIVMAVTKIVKEALEDSLQMPIYRLYQLLIDISLRFDTQVKLEGMFRNLGIILVGLLLYSFQVYIPMEAHFQPLVVLILLPLTIFIAMQVNQKYIETLQDNLNEQQTNVEKQKVMNLSLADKLVLDIQKVPLQRITIVLNILKILNPVIYREGILKLISSEEEKIQEIALKEAGKLCVLEAIPILDRLMQSKYFPVLNNSELITRTYHLLRGAEFRLERMKYIEQLTLSKQVPERIFGAMLTTYSEESMKARLLNKLFQDPIYPVRYQAVVASANSQSKDLYNNLIDKLATPLYSNAAFAAIVATGEKMFPALESAFYMTGQKEVIQLRIIQIYGRIASEEAIKFLLEKLNFSNKNVSLLALDVLSKCNYNFEEEEKTTINIKLEEACSILTWNLSAYLDLEKHDVDEILMEAMQAEIESNYENIFNLLSLLYDSSSIDLIQKNIKSGDPEKGEFALELLEILLPGTLDPIVLPLLGADSYQEKVKSLQHIFPTQSMGKIELLTNLIQRDYNWINRWTKACALDHLSRYKEQADITVFVANMANPDIILSEIATKSLYELNQVIFEENVERLRVEKKYMYIRHITNVLINSTDSEMSEDLILKFNIAKLLRQVPEFKQVPGLTLSEIAKMAELIICQPGQELGKYYAIDEADYFLVHSGTLSLQTPKGELKEFSTGTWLHSLDLRNQDFSRRSVNILAKTECILYKMSKAKFDELLSFYDEVPESVLSQA